MSGIADTYSLAAQEHKHSAPSSNITILLTSTKWLTIENPVASVAEAVECILADGLETAMNRFNRRGAGL